MAEIDVARASVRALTKNMLRDTSVVIQDAKLLAGLREISRAQREGDMPAMKDITHYVTSTNRRNAYPDYNRFRRVMRNSPKYTFKRFIHVGGIEGKTANESILAAARMASELVRQRTRMYPKSTAPLSRHKSTGNLYNSIRTFVNGDMVVNVQKAISESETPPIFEISNIAPYASTAEARSYYHRVGGIIWYAANRVQRAFPELGVFFGFERNQEAWGHYYWSPVLRIGTREMVTGRWVEPGQNHRKRIRQVRRIERIFKDGT